MTRLQLKEGRKITWEANLDGYDENDISSLLNEVDQTMGNIDEFNKSQKEKKE